MSEMSPYEQEIVWQPTAEVVKDSNLQQFMNHHGIGSFSELLERAAADPSWFWAAVVNGLGIEWYQPYQQVLDLSAGPALPRWFVGGRMNIAHNCLDKYMHGPTANKPAIVWEGEDGRVRQLTYRDVWREANRLAGGLRSLGVGRGDRIGIYLPMLPENVIAIMACAKLGAIFTPIFSGYGAEAVATRLKDCEAVALITADGFLRRGQIVAMKETADQAAALAPSVRHVIVYRHVGRDVAWQAHDHDWNQLVAAQPEDFATEKTDAQDPVMIIYTSGTTGRPKGAVHAHAGFPLKAAQDQWHAFDVKAGDRMFWFTDMGWMMGPWEVFGILLHGATMLLYEGTPDYPQPDRLWDLIERHRVTVLGISPTAIRALMSKGDDWVLRHDLSSLRILGSSGEPWNPEPWRWFFERVGGGRCPIINYSGGTEISGGILGCFPILPLKPCSFSGPLPGMAADVVDDDGQPVRGRVGELVLRAPWVGITQAFWRDQERYLETYWSRFPGVWVHGDWAMIDDDGFWFILGRSDDTLKIAGKRVGPAELESALVSHPAVAEAAAIGVPDEVKGEAAVLFALLRPGQAASERLRSELKQHVVAQLGKALAPKEIRFVADLPRTRSGKIMRRVVRAAYLGTAPGDVSSLENPQAVDEVAHAQ